MESLFPKLKNDISLRANLEKLSQLPQSPEPALVAQLFVEMEELFSRMSAGSMSDQEKFIMLIKKLHPKTFSELRSDRYYKHRSEDYKSLKTALLEKVMKTGLKEICSPRKSKISRLWIPKVRLHHRISRRMPKMPPHFNPHLNLAKARAKEKVKMSLLMLPEIFTGDLQDLQEIPRSLQKHHSQGFRRQFGANFAKRRVTMKMHAGLKQKGTKTSRKSFPQMLTACQIPA
jgi:hypothetical protein